MLTQQTQTTSQHREPEKVLKWLGSHTLWGFMTCVLNIIYFIVSIYILIFNSDRLMINSQKSTLVEIRHSAHHCLGTFLEIPRPHPDPINAQDAGGDHTDFQKLTSMVPMGILHWDILMHLYRKETVVQRFKCPGWCFTKVENDHDHELGVISSPRPSHDGYVQGGEEGTEDKMVGCHHQFSGRCTNSGRQWRTGKPGVLKFMGSQRVTHDWVTEQQQHVYIYICGFPWWLRW